MNQRVEAWINLPLGEATIEVVLTGGFADGMVAVMPERLNSIRVCGEVVTHHDLVGTDGMAPLSYTSAVYRRDGAVATFTGESERVGP